MAIQLLRCGRSASRPQKRGPARLAGQARIYRSKALAGMTNMPTMTGHDHRDQQRPHGARGPRARALKAPQRFLGTRWYELWPPLPLTRHGGRGMQRGRAMPHPARASRGREGLVKEHCIYAASPGANATMSTTPAGTVGQWLRIPRKGNIGQVAPPTTPSPHGRRPLQPLPQLLPATALRCSSRVGRRLRRATKQMAKIPGSSEEACTFECAASMCGW
jgi:hypothetical protein